jgi:C-terminal processing protease CtpA/Prc
MAGDTAACAMNFLANTDALIVDLRNNGGGTPAMGVLLASYFFAAEPVHYADNYARPGNTTRQWWTLPYVPGKRYGIGKPVYILTGKRTFSAAEGFAYHLKNLKRAIIVGEVTRGGANTAEAKRIADHVVLYVPTGRGVSPITGTNWEGVGVQPDQAIPGQQALKVVHLDALNRLLGKAEEPQSKDQIKSFIQGVQKELDG